MADTNDHEMTEIKNGEAMDTDSKSKVLADYGLNESVVTKLEELFTAGIFYHYFRGWLINPCGRSKATQIWL